MENLGTFLYEASNVVLLVVWLALAFSLWRVRGHKLLKGGELPVIATLIAYAYRSASIIFGVNPWTQPTFMATVTALTVCSAVIIISALRSLPYKCPKDDSPKLVIELNGRVAERYAAMHKTLNGE